MVDFTRASDVGWQIEQFGRKFDSVVLVCGSQMGKTDAMLDIKGAHSDQRPAPILYVGPTENFVNREIEPRLTDMLMTSATLRAKLAMGKKNTRYRKLVGGVPIALAWAGSAAQVAGMAAKIALIDELDRMAASVQGEGDPFALVEARGFSYADRVRLATSTPLLGVVDSAIDPASGLEFWREMAPEDVQSPIWRLWQGGTRHHWCWPCPHCAEYFVPRLKLLRYAEDATPAQARREAHLECPRCAGQIEESHKRAMNARGRYVAPGQTIDAEGVIRGEPGDVTTLSYWVSGLCSPFVTFGDRAASYVAARRSQNEDRVQAVVNTGFGELFAPGAGDVPEWQEVAELRHEYRRGRVPPWVQRLTLTADVQRRRILYTVRGWGAFGTSCTVEYGELHGPTTEKGVWDQLATVLTSPMDGHVIARALVDSGFRPGKPETVPVNAVYRFCRQFKNRAFPSKGRATMDKPVTVRKADLTARGDVHRYGLNLVWLDTNWGKSTVHERIRWEPGTAGAWTIPADASEDYCKQIVSEARTLTETGQPVWKARSRENHFLDCEAMQEGLGHWLNLHLLRPIETEKADAAEAERRKADTKAARAKRLQALVRRHTAGTETAAR